MNNLIKNSHWAPGPNGGPMYFSGAVATYDDLSIDGYRTCSITMAADSGMIGIDRYDPAIDVSGQCAISWGYIIRVTDADSIMLIADFHDCNNNLIHSSQCNITQNVDWCFSRQMCRFPIPCDAQYVHLSMQFKCKVTSCTFYAPMAFFCN